MTNFIGKRDAHSGAVISTDSKAFAKAKQRKLRAREIQTNEAELSHLRNQVENLTSLVEQLLKERTQ